MIETVQERIRNKVGVFYTIMNLFKNISNEEDYENRMKIINYMVNHSEQISNTMENSINYLIDIGIVLDQNLPNNFDINNMLDKRKYQKNNETKEIEN